MRPLRSFLALSVIAVLAVACSTPSASQPTDSNGGGGGGATATPGSGGGGGGGGGGGANGSLTYRVTGDHEDSGELPFQPLISDWIESESGWLANFVLESGEGAYVQMNTAASGQILNFGDGTVLISAVSDPSSGFDCTFTFTKNDSTGLAGSMECNDIIGTNLTSGAQLTVDISAEWDAHP